MSNEDRVNENRIDITGAQPAPPPDRPARASRRPMKAFAVLALLLVIGDLVVLLYMGQEDGRYEPSRTIRLDEPASDGSGNRWVGMQREHALRVAIAPVISPEDSLRLYADLVDYLAEQLGRTPVSLQRETYLEVNDLIRYGRCDLAFVCTYAFVRGEREFGMEAVAVPQVRGQVTYHSLIIVPAESAAESLLDLQGKRFASADLLSNTGWLYPAMWLKERSADPDDFFGRHVISGSHDQSVTAVTRGFVDGAAVDSLVYDQMILDDASLAIRLKIIARSPPYGMPPLVTSPRVSADLKGQLRAALLGMHESEAGRKILASLHIDRFVAPDDSLYDSVRTSVARFESNP